MPHRHIHRFLQKQDQDIHTPHKIVYLQSGHSMLHHRSYILVCCSNHRSIDPLHNQEKRMLLELVFWLLLELFFWLLFVVWWLWFLCRIQYQMTGPPIYLHLIFDILQFEISSLMHWIFDCGVATAVLVTVFCLAWTLAWNWVLNRMRL